MGGCTLLPVGPGQIRAGPSVYLVRVGIPSQGSMLAPQVLALWHDPICGALGTVWPPFC